LLEAARQLGTFPSRCVYVGDDERDIIAGRAAGMPTVAAAYGYLGQTTDTQSWNADFTISSPSNLLNLL
jgi:N-acetyl-D-muramate 6-phosphate phosphatase